MKGLVVLLVLSLGAQSAFAKLPDANDPTVMQLDNDAEYLQGNPGNVAAIEGIRRAIKQLNDSNIPTRLSGTESLSNEAFEKKLKLEMALSGDTKRMGCAYAAIAAFIMIKACTASEAPSAPTPAPIKIEQSLTAG